MTQDSPEPRSQRIGKRARHVPRFPSRNATLQGYRFAMNIQTTPPVTVPS